MEDLRQAAARIFRQAYIPKPIRRTGQQILMAPLYGPQLKSYWPLRMTELSRFWRTQYNTEIPLSNAVRYVDRLTRALHLLPYPQSRIYRQSIGLWRHNRGKMARRGESKITSTNLGRIVGTRGQ